MWLCCVICCTVTGAGPTPPRSDGRVLHADLENYTDGVVQCLNAGVRWLGDPFSGRREGTVVVTKDFAFAGLRCAHVHSERNDQIARVRLQHRFDAPSVAGDAVFEVVFRPVRAKAVDLEDMTVWEAKASNGRPVGLILLANGEAAKGTYRLDLVHGGKKGNEQTRVDGVVKALPQARWVRIVQRRRRADGHVDLWLGSPGHEALVGTYADLLPAGDPRSVEIGDTSTSRHRGSGYWDDIRLGGVLADGGTVAPPEPPLRDVSKELPVIKTPIVVGRQRQLFVDDAVIESSRGLKRTLHAVKKHPMNPLIVPEHPWEGKCVLLYGGVVRDPEGGKFRMWYLAWGKHVGQPSFVCYAESDDGLRWTKPRLGLRSYRGSKQNNIVMDGWSQTTVLHDPDDPDPSRRYKAVLRLNGTRGFLSPDGLRWRDVGVILEQAYDGTTVHWDPVGRKWIAMVKVFRDGKRSRGYAESRDFVHWTDTYFMATVDRRDAPADQMYAMYLFYYEGVYFGLLRMYHTDSDVVDIQLATSRNGKHWDRSIRTAFIPTTPREGAWDRANNAVPSTPPVRVRDKLWFYYSGRGTLHNEKPNTGAIGLGTLRVDGFMSMDAQDSGGALTTKPLRLSGRRLFVNADAKAGRLCVEILDERGEVIAPFARANCQAITTDGVRQALRWRGATGLEAIANRTVRLRFHIEGAKLYAFWCE